MFNKHEIHSYIKYSVAAAILYLICVVVFLSKGAYTQTYILFLGNTLFAIPIVFFVVHYANKRGRNSSTQMAISAGIATTLIGIILSCLSIFIILAIMEPSAYRDVTDTARELSSPTPGLEGNGFAIIMMLFMDAVLGNMAFGAFVAAMLSNMLKSDQTGETATINPEKA